MAKVAFFTLGCKVNQADTASLEQLFVAADYEVVDFQEQADVYVINTCVVTSVGQKKSRQVIRRAVSKNPAAIVAVTGCYPQTAAQEVSDIKGVSVIVGVEQRGNIVQLVEEAKSFGKIEAVDSLPAGLEFEELATGQVDGRTRAFLKIQEGCNQFCSYCIIPYARGRLRSRSLESILLESEALVAAGFKEIVLIGIHLGAYGCEQPGQPRLAQAVKSVLSADGIKRVRLGSLESIELDDDLLRLMQVDERVCRHLHLPLQSGCDVVLKQMNRPYNTAQFARLVDNVRAMLPDVALTTDVIVGFPGETEELFEQTCRFVAGMNFSRLHIFPFSVRPGTPAADFPDQVSERVKAERVKRMSVIANASRKKFLQGLVGKTVRVLFEQGEADGLMSGMADSYVRVFVTRDDSLVGQICLVYIKALYQDYLLGEIIYL